MARLAIIGSGIAGLGCAHFLHRHFDLTLFEQNDRAGGHTITVPATGTHRPVAVDTGFMVCHKTASPHLTRLFAQLGVRTKPAPISLSVRHAASGLEFRPGSFNHLFSQRKNLLSPRFWRLLATIARFNQEALPSLDEPDTHELTLGAYVRRRRYGDDFFDLYLAPIGSSLWSTPPDLMLSFPATTFLRFFHLHGFLDPHSQPPWLTLDDGASSCVEKISAPFLDRIHLRRKAVRVLRHGRDGGATVTTADGTTQSFDKVILACHADQALRILINPTADESRLLGEFHYQHNTATLHTDTSVMPRTPRAWSAWNHEIARETNGRVSTATHFWMNRLQGLSDRENYFVTINRPEAIAPEHVLKRVNYEHPLFSLGTSRAQAGLPLLNQLSPAQAVYFCGSYFHHGLHENAFASAVAVAQTILARDPWNGA